MTRALHADVVTQTEANVVHPVLLVKFEFDSDDLRLCTGYIPITFNSEEYTPTGDLGKISVITEETELNANGVELELSGIPSEWLSIALSENYQDRTVTVWDAFLNSSGAIAGGDSGPIPHVFRCDTMRIADGGEFGSIVLTAESVLRRLEQGSPGTFTTQWQRRILGGLADTGFNQINQTIQSEIFWGRERDE